MDIRGFDLNNDKNLSALDAANLMSVYQEAKSADPVDHKNTSAEYLVDRHESEAFNQIKSVVAGAHHAGRSAYLQNLKDAISSGEYKVSTTDLVDAMFADGTAAMLAL